MTYGDARLPARFWDKVITVPWSGCWLWLGSLLRDGYGSFHVSADVGRQVAHRVAWEALVEPIAAGLQLDHLCRERSCCNPAHLEPVTKAENQRRGLCGDLTTHCPHGHEYTPANTYWNPNNGRKCRECARLSSIKRYAEARRG